MFGKKDKEVKKGGTGKKILIGCVAVGVIGAAFGNKDAETPKEDTHKSAMEESLDTSALEKYASEEAQKIVDDAMNKLDEYKNELEQVVASADVSEIVESVVEGAVSEALEEELVDGMRPSFKKAMDSYEAFYKEYCDFMKSYDVSDTKMLMEYMELVQKEEEMAKAFDKWDGNMNDKETAYYLEVSMRVQKMLLEAIPKN